MLKKIVLVSILFGCVTAEASEGSEKYQLIERGFYFKIGSMPKSVLFYSQQLTSKQECKLLAENSKKWGGYNFRTSWDCIPVAIRPLRANEAEWCEDKKSNTDVCTRGFCEIEKCGH